MVQYHHLRNLPGNADVQSKYILPEVSFICCFKPRQLSREVHMKCGFPT